jgi:hypothetical protein
MAAVSGTNVAWEETARLRLRGVAELSPHQPTRTRFGVHSAIDGAYLPEGVPP